ncbi:SprT-like domain-containing protein, partial [Bacteroidota bacterium]
MEKSEFSNLLSAYIPELSLDLIYDVFSRYNAQLIISKPRLSKLGDFRPPVKGSMPRISVNGDLNKYEFLITLLHEMAHLIAWKQHNRFIKPHGHEWGNIFKLLIEDMLCSGIFPEEIKVCLNNEIEAGRNNFSNLNSKLVKALEKFSDEKKMLRLDNIPEKAKFVLPSGKIMEKGEKL